MPVTWLQNDGVSNEFIVDLRRALRSTGTEFSADAKSAEAVLTISKEDRSRRVLSVGSTGKVQEYELHYAISFRVSDAAGKERLPEQSISRLRDYSFDQNDVLAKQSEESLLYRDMRRDVINEILRRLQKLRQKARDETGG
ncbi:MAG: LPS-assembly lipoprotein [Gammaproteobacteria bacterium]|nr:MAG: LPS-assembly lipoprotein [Gammaproteobacteria bacterium]TND06293.1 MAG: LPS-assembly lipoprotein [Gammaproteobacteria bacterium]